MLGGGWEHVKGVCVSTRTVGILGAHNEKPVHMGKNSRVGLLDSK